MSAETFLRHFASRPDIAARVADVTFADNGCWLWPSKRYIKVGRRGNRRFLHRISLEIKLGEPLGRRHALHGCDDPRCCNPEHLRPGTHADNMRDMAERGRVGNKVFHGIENNKATLTDDEIVAALVRLDAGETITAVAASVGVTRRAVQTWREGIARRAAHEKWLEVRSGNNGKPIRLRVWQGGAPC